MAQPQIVEEFLELVRLPANSKQEQVLAQIVTNKLQQLGCQVEEDNTGSIIGGNSGNIIARLPGTCPQTPTILFSAHLDRVANHGNIIPSIQGDYIVSDGTSILGADDVSGICAILDGIRRVLAHNSPRGDIEIVFSVAEEIGLLGAKNLDYTKLKSRLAFVIDTCGPISTVVNQAPTQYTMTIKVHGQSAHAGLEPEKGTNAIQIAAIALAQLPQGRLSPATTSNFGLIQGGTAINIVSDYTEITGEARSLNETELKDYLTKTQNAFTQTATKFGASIEFQCELEYTTFHLNENEEVIQIANQAMKELGLTMNLTTSGGGMDGHFFNQNQIKTIGLSSNYQAVHTPQERQPISDLIKCGQLISKIIQQTTKSKP